MNIFIFAIYHFVFLLFFFCWLVSWLNARLSWIDITHLKLRFYVYCEIAHSHTIRLKNRGGIKFHALLISLAAYGLPKWVCNVRGATNLPLRSVEDLLWMPCYVILRISCHLWILKTIKEIKQVILKKNCNLVTI